MLEYKYSESRLLFCWSSPPKWSALALTEHPSGVLPNGGGTRFDPRCAVACIAQAGKLGQCSNGLDGLSCMHQLFPGREPINYTNGSRRSLLCKTKTNRCPCRALPTIRLLPQNLNDFEHFCAKSHLRFCSKAWRCC